MPKIYEVSNVEEAVVLASKFQDEGKYNWFRGQTKDWAPHASLFRLKDKKELIPEIDRTYYAFIDWIEKKEELKYLLKPENIHQLEAVLQHYGFPTYYIDFTTEPSVAGFFACDTNSPPTDGYSCIYCLNTEELSSVWAAIKNFDSRKEAHIEQISVDVSNLWRLQAQKGVFLYANYNWEMDYPLDKIIFPYTTYPSYPTRDVIYPEHKSMLEMLLDEFFDAKRGADAIKEVLSGVTNIKVHHFAPFENGYYKDVFKKDAELKVLQSWIGQNWSVYKEEEYHATTGVFQKISLRGRVDEDEIKGIITYGIRQILRSNKTLRTKAVDWVLEYAHSGLNATKISLLLAKIWDGMRQLPFSDEDISIACGNLIYLHIKGVRNLDRSDQINIFNELFGEGIFVGFSVKPGNGSRGFASKQSIINALEPELVELLVDEVKDMAYNPKGLFSIIYNPRLMFDFDKFKTFFAQEVIPSQIAIYEQYVIFNPHEIYIFGNP